MGRALLSHFLIVSNSSPRLVSSLSRGGLPSKYCKTPGLIRQNRNLATHNGCGFRCYCNVSLSEPTAPVASSSSVKKRIVSGVQPTGSIHLGNYLGAIKNWIALQPFCDLMLQNSYETLFFIVDLHAITLPYDTQQLSKATRETAAIYLACGIDNSKSHVRAHLELMWLLSSATPIGWLNKMIQFKEKSHKAGDENVGVALLTYPVLMASDILLYQSDFVPVGEDQKQHLELTRELAERVNYLYGGRKWKKLGGRGGAIFKVPEPLIPPAGARVMSLTDGLSKMSKSAPSDQSRINLLDPKDRIEDDIRFLEYNLTLTCRLPLINILEIDVIHVYKRKLVSDVVSFLSLTFAILEFDNLERPECNNLLSIYQLISGKTKGEVAEECQNMNWGTFKPLLTDALIEHLHPIQVRYEEIMSDSAYLDKVLADGAAKAADIADATLNNVYQAMGFLRR
ncbi:Tryptophanyl-tRNA synthetase [Citrus sinensis]|nr:Tryptophanyl-tRNA synthetase [Citrus sinensis]